MRKVLLLLIALASCVAVNAKDMKGKVLNDANRKGVRFATLIVEYPDTIITYEADKKGRFSINPLSFPITITVKGEGMKESLIGLMSMPDHKLVIELSPDSSATSVSHKPDWSSAMPRRLSSKFIVRNSAAKN